MTVNLSKLKICKKPELIILTGIMLLSLLTHIYNLGGYPQFFCDEGTYIQRAIRLNQLHIIQRGCYEHPFFGWVLIALYLILVGFTSTKLYTIETFYFISRSLFLILSVINILLIYRISKKLYDREEIALCASAIFAVAPMSTYWFRMVLLDSIMITFVLLSTFVFLERKKILLSSLLFGCAVLTKLPALFFTPGMLYLLYSRKVSRKQTIVWLAGVMSVVSLFPLNAIMNGEFNRLIQGQLGQITRLPFGSLEFLLRYFQTFDPILFVLGFAGLIVVLRKDKFIPILIFGYSLFLLLTGYKALRFLIPLIPLLSITASYTLFGAISKAKFKIVGIVAVMIIVLMSMQTSTLIVRDYTSIQIQAINYVIENAPENSIIICSQTYATVLDQYHKWQVYTWYKKFPTDLTTRTYFIVDLPARVDMHDIPELMFLYEKLRTEKVFNLTNAQIVVELDTEIIIKSNS